MGSLIIKLKFYFMVKKQEASQGKADKMLVNTSKPIKKALKLGIAESKIKKQIKSTEAAAAVLLPSGLSEYHRRLLN